MNWEDLDYWKQFNIKSEHYMNRYINFIKSIQNKGERELDYCEHHHIVPRSFINNNNYTIELTSREHFIAHYILTKCFNGNCRRNMIFAFKFFINPRKNNRRNYTVSSRVYEYSRRIRSEYERNKVVSEETRKKMSENHADFSGDKHPMYGKGYLLKEEKNGRYGIKLKYINNGVKNKMVRYNEVDNYLNNGWKLGMLKKKSNNMTRNNKGNRNPAYGTKLMNNGLINKRIKIDEVESYCNIGWKLGMLIK